jgi:hypothetical protein
LDEMILFQYKPKIWYDFHCPPVRHSLSHHQAKVLNLVQKHNAIPPSPRFQWIYYHLVRFSLNLEPPSLTEL